MKSYTSPNKFGLLTSAPAKQWFSKIFHLFKMEYILWSMEQSQRWI